MKDSYYRLLRLALAAGLADKETFVEKISKVISEKTTTDPRYGDRIARSLFSAIEAFRDELQLRQLFSDASGTRKTEHRDEEALIEKIDRLQRTLDEIRETLNEKAS